LRRGYYDIGASEARGQIRLLNFRANFRSKCENLTHRIFRRKFGLPLFFRSLAANGLIVILWRVRLPIALGVAIPALRIVVLSILHFVSPWSNQIFTSPIKYVTNEH
jgi:hypothetical protein